MARPSRRSTDPDARPGFHTPQGGSSPRRRWPNIARFFKQLICRHQWFYSRKRSSLYCPACKATRRVP
ncbi:MAG: hypothetical protein NTV19_00220 [Burkholderiales bacterium]|nr:hypothetical protein [Burkholderiales bacterium]